MPVVLDIGGMTSDPEVYIVESDDGRLRMGSCCLPIKPLNSK